MGMGKDTESLDFFFKARLVWMITDYLSVLAVVIQNANIQVIKKFMKNTFYIKNISFKNLGNTINSSFKSIFQ